MAPHSDTRKNIYLQQMIPEEIPTPVMAMDREFRIVYINPSGCRMLGVPYEDVQGRSYFECFPARDGDLNCSPVYAAQLTGMAQCGEYDATVAGRVVPLECTATPMKDMSGGVFGLVVHLSDISERRKADEAVRVSEEKYRRVVENSNEAIFVVQDGRLRFFNPKLEDISGYGAEELLQIRLMDIVHQDDIPAARRALRMRPGETCTAEISIRIIDRESRVHWVTVSAVHMVWEGAPAALVFAGDITSRMLLEEQLRQAQKMEAIGRLAGGVAHDFNNLLTVISGYAEMVRQQLGKDHAAAEDTEEVIKAAARAAELTQQLLTFSRKAVVKLVVMDLNRCIRDTGQMLKRIIGEDVRLRLALREGLSHVKADASQIGQILLNLASNARDAMPEGGALTIETRDVELDKAYAESHTDVVPGRYVMLSVSDTGCGMDEETRRRAFEPFFTTKDEHKGTGLGLATVYGIVSQHKGHIHCYSERNVGTTFAMYFPVEEVPAQPAPREPACRPPQVGTETVLVVEDEPSILEMAVHLLGQQGYKVIQASSGEEAVELIGNYEGKIHLLLTDVVLPGIDGKQVADALNVTRPNARVIFTSGYTDSILAQRGVLDDEMEFLQKPYRLDDLLGCIRRVLDSGPALCAG